MGELMLGVQIGAKAYHPFLIVLYQTEYIHRYAHLRIHLYHFRLQTHKVLIAFEHPFAFLAHQKLLFHGQHAGLQDIAYYHIHKLEIA